MNESALQPGQILARGVSRHLRQAQGMATLEEYVPAKGLRVDVIALSSKGEIWVIECKSCRADFTSDGKWQGYLPWCDRFFFAVDADFPNEILPPEAGLIIADGYDAQIITYPDPSRLAPARRKAMTCDLARQSMLRLSALRDPAPRGLI